MSLLLFSSRPTETRAWVSITSSAGRETRDAKMNPAPWPSNGPPGSAKPQPCRQLRGRRINDADRLTPPGETATILDSAWVAQTADHVLRVMEESRSTWQMWHVRAEAQRQVRTSDLPSDQAAALVDVLVDEVLDRRSIALATLPDNIEEPDVLRWVDGSSVYTVADATVYTSQRILDAEQRLLTAAGRRDGASVEQTAVDFAVLEMAANRTALDAGQAALVRQMCTSGGRLQLAIAPAGAGKTTAMRALTVAWTGDGGQVIGLAPSAAAAAVLGAQTGIRTDTLAN